MAIEDLMRMLKPGSVICGDAINAHREILRKKSPAAILAEREFWYPQGRFVLSAARKRLGAADLTDAFKVKPIYLYPKECQIRNYNEKLQANVGRDKSQ